MSHTPPPYGAPSETKKQLLTAEELAGIEARSAETWGHIAGQRYPTEEMAAEAINDRADLLEHISAATAGHHAREAEKEEQWDNHEHRLRNELQKQIGEELKAVNELYEAKIASLKSELAEQEVLKLELIRQLAPLPFPANKPAEDTAQYFCLCGPGSFEVALLMWADPSNFDWEAESTGAVWCEWDGTNYTPIGQHLVTAFWPHPKAPKHAH